jgi:hypothetical protein
MTTFIPQDVKSIGINRFIAQIANVLAVFANDHWKVAIFLKTDNTSITSAGSLC